MDNLLNFNELLHKAMENEEFFDMYCVGWRACGLVFLVGWIVAFSSTLAWSFYEDSKTHSYYRNIKQIMHRFEMQGILGIEITYHHTQFYISYLDYEVCADDLLKGLMKFQELLYSEKMYRPPLYMRRKIKFKCFIGKITAKIKRVFTKNYK